MKILLSPSKSLNLNQKISGFELSKPHFLKEIGTLISTLKKLKKEDLMAIMSISEKLAAENMMRYKFFDINFESKDCGPAILSFAGDVYTGLKAESFSKKEMERANQQIFILSGLYGALKPLDRFLPYRLEMGTNLSTGKSKNLYDFWSDKVSNFITGDNKETIINLASDEYYNVVKPHLKNSKVIQINFKEWKDNKWTFISFNAKKSRGLVANYIIKNNVKNVEDLKKFKEERYIFNESFSTENQWIFTRKFISVAVKKKII